MAYLGSPVLEDFRARYLQVPWRDIADLRHRRIHGYDTIIFDILWKIVQDDVPPLLQRLAAIVQEAT